MSTMKHQKLSSAISDATEKRKNTIGKRDGGKPVRGDYYGTYPTKLYELVERKQWMETIQRCADYPREASVCKFERVNGNGDQKKEFSSEYSPLLSAIILRAPVEVIRALVDAYPNGTKIRDNRKMLPLHIAFRLGASPKTVAILVRAYPYALTSKDSKGHTPRQILKAYRREYEKEENKGKYINVIDRNRKDLINMYLASERFTDNGRHRRIADCEMAKNDISVYNSILNTDPNSSCDESEDVYNGCCSRMRC